MAAPKRRVIRRYELGLTDEIILAMPALARPLAIGIANGLPVLWTLEKPDASTVQRRFCYRYEDIPADTGGLTYIGSTVFGPSLSLHLFERTG